MSESSGGDPRSDGGKPNSFFPAVNQGDAAILFCFVFLYLFFSGPGAFAVDNRKTA